MPVLTANIALNTRRLRHVHVLGRPFGDLDRYDKDIVRPDTIYDGIDEMDIRSTHLIERPVLQVLGIKDTRARREAQGLEEAKELRALRRRHLREHGLRAAFDGD